MTAKSKDFAVADLTGSGRLDIIAPGKDGLAVFSNLGLTGKDAVPVKRPAPPAKAAGARAWVSGLAARHHEKIRTREVS